MHVQMRLHFGGAAQKNDAWEASIRAAAPKVRRCAGVAVEVGQSGVAGGRSSHARRTRYRCDDRRVPRG